MDFVINLPHMPPKDGAVMANEIFYQGGGKVASALVASARLGAESGMIAHIGGDTAGDFILRDFSYNGVDTSRIVRDRKDKSSAFCISMSEMEFGTRCFIGKLKKEFSMLQIEDLDYNYISSAKILHIESGDPVSTAAAKFAHENGILVSIDADHYTEEFDQLLPYIDIFIGSEYYLKIRYGDLSYKESSEAVHKAGPSVVWFTLGKNGCIGLINNRFYEIPAYNVTVHDTTGAGDVFHGAYLAAMLEGLAHEECARYACAVSSIKCTFVGGRTGIPTREVLSRYMDDGIILQDEFEKRLEYYRSNF
jgi:sugar/nucleoside kinase (ribokinase family)